jgi:hypothetical protein
MAVPTPTITASFCTVSANVSSYGRDRRGLTITRGTTSPQLTGFVADAGHASTTLSNRDLRFDPNNLTGPYVTGGVTDVVPGVPVTIQTTYP